ncbi:MAG: PD40 domain-containing protein [Nitrospinae bacterium]|nr:PD40 domain-containing protein [Nitrospinota bacterium]
MCNISRNHLNSNIWNMVPIEILAMKSIRGLGFLNKLPAGCILLVLLLSSAVLAGSEEGRSKSLQAVFEKNGNIFLKVENNIVQLTKTGRDHAPLLSPDGKWVAFIREIEGKVKECSEDKDLWVCASDQLWSIDLATRAERMIVEPLEDTPDARKAIANISNMTFSPDSKTLYFETQAWAVSGAIHAVDPDGKNERFVTDGDDLRVIKRSWIEKLTGHLVMHKHKYFMGGGAYDLFWLTTPTGKELGPLGEFEDMEYFTRGLKLEYMDNGFSTREFSD